MPSNPFALLFDDSDDESDTAALLGKEDAPSKRSTLASIPLMLGTKGERTASVPSDWEARAARSAAGAAGGTVRGGRGVPLSPEVVREAVGAGALPSAPSSTHDAPSAAAGGAGGGGPSQEEMRREQQQQREYDRQLREREQAYMQDRLRQHQLQLQQRRAEAAMQSQPPPQQSAQQRSQQPPHSREYDGAHHGRQHHGHPGAGSADFAHQHQHQHSRASPPPPHPIGGSGGSSHLQGHGHGQHLQQHGLQQQQQQQHGRPPAALMAQSRYAAAAGGSKQQAAPAAGPADFPALGGGRVPANPIARAGSAPASLATPSGASAAAVAGLAPVQRAYSSAGSTSSASVSRLPAGAGGPTSPTSRLPPGIKSGRALGGSSGSVGGGAAAGAPAGAGGGWSSASFSGLGDIAGAGGNAAGAAKDLGRPQPGFVASTLPNPFARTGSQQQQQQQQQDHGRGPPSDQEGGGDHGYRVQQHSRHADHADHGDLHAHHQRSHPHPQSHQHPHPHPHQDQYGSGSSGSSGAGQPRSHDQHSQHNHHPHHAHSQHHTHSQHAQHQHFQQHPQQPQHSQPVGSSRANVHGPGAVGKPSSSSALAAQAAAAAEAKAAKAAEEAKPPRNPSQTLIDLVAKQLAVEGSEELLWELPECSCESTKCSHVPGFSSVCASDVTFVALVEAFAEADPPRLDDAMELLRALLKDGAELNATVFEVAIAACSEVDPPRPDTAKELLELMKATPDCSSNASLLQVYCAEPPETRDLKEIVSVLATMVKEDAAPDRDTCCAVATALATAVPAHVDGAIQVLETMVGQRMVPTLAAFNAVVVGCSNASTPRVDDILGILGAMRLNKVAPDRTTYAALLNACVSAAPIRVNEACVVIAAMVAANLKPDAGSCSRVVCSLLAGAGRAPRFADAIRVIGAIPPTEAPSLEAYARCLKYGIDHGDGGAAVLVELLRGMHRHKLVPIDELYGRVFAACVSTGSNISGPCEALAKSAGAAKAFQGDGYKAGAAVIDICRENDAMATALLTRLARRYLTALPVPRYDDAIGVMKNIDFKANVAQYKAVGVELMAGILMQVPDVGDPHRPIPHPTLNPLGYKAGMELQKMIFDQAGQCVA